jgi:hypothetical protein
MADIDVKKSYRYNLQIDLVNKTDPESVIDLSPFLIELVGMNFYKDNVFPIIRLDLVINNEVYNKLQNETDDINLILTIKKIELNTSNVTMALMVQYPFEYYCKNVKLKVFDVKRRPIGNSPDKYPKIPVTLFCFLEKHLEVNKRQISRVYSNCTMNEVMLALCTEFNITDILMDSSENTKRYKQVIIPPLNFTNSIYYLQEVYGIYRFGINLFFDLRYSYFLRNDALEKPPTIKEVPYSFGKVVFEIKSKIESKDYDKDAIGYALDLQNQCFIIHSSDNFKMNNTESTIKESGEMFKLVSRGSSDQNHNIQDIADNFDSLTTPGKSVKHTTNPKEIIRWQNYTNPFTLTEHEFTINTSMLSADKALSGIDLDVFSPNRNYILNYMHQKQYADKYNGYYKISSLVYSFKAGDSTSDFLTVMAGCKLAKLNKKYHP